MRPPAVASPRRAHRGSACGSCFGRAVTAAGALPRAGGLFFGHRPRLEAVRSVRPGVLRDAPGQTPAGAA